MTLQVESPPLIQDESGAWRVGATRVLLELVIRAFQDGAAPEAIVQRYSTLKLGDVYAVIGYYLRHSVEINAYLQAREQQAASLRTEIESRQGDLAEIRQRILRQAQQ